MKHILQVVFVNSAAFWIYLANVNAVLTFVSLLLAISYTVYRFLKDSKR